MPCRVIKIDAGNPGELSFAGAVHAASDYRKVMPACRLGNVSQNLSGPLPLAVLEPIALPKASVDWDEELLTLELQRTAA
jgi:hypothetical protein